MLVFRHRRSLLYWLDTVISAVPAFTSNSCPLRAFPGSPPSAGGLNRGSAHAPVHVGGSAGSTGASKCVSLYVINVRYGVLDPSVLGAQRVFQKISLPVNIARLTPALRAASTLARSPPDQYSSWPLNRINL